MSIKYTLEQQRAIDERKKNILVSAAAGSGKTAVLVERIIRLISDPCTGVDIDRILVLTFTKSAAISMRDKISEAISHKVSNDPENNHLIRQSLLLHNAQITTIDSFCLFLIKNYFRDIDLDPGFRIADESEVSLIKQEAMEEVLEQFFTMEGAENREFVDMVESLATDGKLRQVETCINELYISAESHPWPDTWIKERSSDYDVMGVDVLSDTIWGSFAIKQIMTLLSDIEDRIEHLIQLCGDAGGPYYYTSALVEDKSIVLRISQCKSYVEFYNAFRMISFARLASKKDESVDEELREYIKDMRNDIKKIIKNTQDRFFNNEHENILLHMERTSKRVKSLAQVTLSYRDIINRKKRDKNIVDFSDMEHFALNVLVNIDKRGEAVLRPVAVELQKYYEEILVDEYQDSNMLQETILEALSGRGGEYNNRFMVGDVKQSIYRFRMARPEIFVDKYKSYLADGDDNIRIDLHKNFRSRGEVLDGVNYIFKQIMTESIGQVNYDNTVALSRGAEYPSPINDNAMEVKLIRYSKDNDLSKVELESRCIASRIKELVNSFYVVDEDTNEYRLARYSDIVILLRSVANREEQLATILKEYGIPVNVADKNGYYASKEISTLINVLKILDNSEQDIPMYGVMSSCFGGLKDDEIVMIRSLFEGSLNIAMRSLVKLSYEEAKTVLREKIEANEERNLLNEENNPKFNKNKSIFNNILIYQILESTMIKAKLLVEFLDRYRAKIPFTQIDDLIRQLINEKDYVAYVKAQPLGDTKVSNVNLLIKRAKNYQRESFYGLFQFVRYIERMEKYNIEVGGSAQDGVGDGNVRIMSIHKSKGLEFPICIVAFLSSNINKRDIRGKMLCHMDMGIAIDYVDPIKRIKISDLRRSIVAQKINMENLGEELRILYVAMTRAKEKLIMTGIIERENKLPKWYMDATSNNPQLSTMLLLSAQSYMDLILPALARHSEYKKLDITINPNELGCISIEDVEPKINIIIEDNSIIELMEVVNEYDSYMDWQEYDRDVNNLKSIIAKRDTLMDVDKDKTENDRLITTSIDIYNKIEQNINNKYQHEDLARVQAKTTISELKKSNVNEALYELRDYSAGILIEEPEIVPYIPRFAVGDNNASPLLIGSAYHKVLETWNMQKEVSVDSVREHIASLIDSTRLSDNLVEILRPEKIVSFLNSDIGIRMRKADSCGLLKREQPFVMGVPAIRVYPECREGETVIIQGIIDAYYIENEEVVLVDYKTDRVDNIALLKDRYTTQIYYYREAIERILNRKVKEAWIYSIWDDKAILC